ncbi:MAG: isoleucine--tRNA ligase [candidate division Zixibacteria bacterium]|nr:isoleucine--tRNA ligase [candidate division Zixibacteria bacterium]
MSSFEEFPKNFSFPETESRILKFWKENKTFEKSVKNRADSPRFVFYEGPPTANGKPGIHHVISRTIKDLFCRYKTMQGFRVDRKGGWDTHGLPVEIEVEKELGINTKPQILEYGVDKFNAKCRASVLRYKKDWDELTERIGYWLDLDDSYLTYTNNYIETVWWILAQLHGRGLITRGHKIIPYCPRCGTGLSSHEVSQGYDQVDDPSVFVKVRLKDKPDTYFLIWTTTPWTLISNLALAVSPQATYAKIEHNGEKLILARDLIDRVIKGEYRILEEFTGQSLEKINYEPLFDFLKLDRSKAYYVAIADFVTLEDGTGIVHIAPFGVDDYTLAQKYNLPLPQPVDESGNFTSEVTPWAGKFIKDADPEIVRDLKHRKLLYKSEIYRHSYPFCWRCDTPLIYYARPSWYIRTTIYKDKLVANNAKIKWHPPDIGAGRFGEWLENNVDWSLSRERFWGTPLNIWVCEKCGEEKAVESIQELQKGENLPDTLDLHKPYVDQIWFKCKCGVKMTRTPEVIDVWFDSGAMPYAQWHYPFENQENFKLQFPADFIAEGVDQTRGWFYSLLAISTLLFDQPAYKNVVVFEFILDKAGQKMSKSRGNVVAPWDILNLHGADALRWYLISASHPWIPTKFDVAGVKEVISKFLGTLINTYSFFALYANIDKFNSGAKRIPVEKRLEIDRWLCSRLNSLIKKCNSGLENYDVTRTARAISDFVIDELSNWYVRRNRRRFWKEAEDQDKLSAYQTLWETLVTISKLIAPLAPFLSEELYQKLAVNKAPGAKASVHLEDYPQPDEAAIDTALESKMSDLIKVVSLGRAARNSSKVKVRQPLSEMQIQLTDSNRQKALSGMEYLIAEEINVKKVQFVSPEIQLAEYSVKPNFARLGPKLGDKVKQAAESIRNLPAAQIQKFRKEGELTLKLNNSEFQLTREDLEIVIQGKEGYAAAGEPGYLVTLNLNISPELEDEGLARELVNRVQNLRKQTGLEVTDRIKLSVQTDPRLKQAVERHRKYIQNETLALDLLFEKQEDSLGEQIDINGHPALISVEKITDKVI